MSTQKRQPTWFETIALCILTGVIVHLVDLNTACHQEESLVELVQRAHREDQELAQKIYGSLEQLRNALEQAGQPIGSPLSPVP